MTNATDRINKRMVELKLSQADLMRGTGAGRATVSGWINGTNAPSARYIDKLAKVLNITSDYILTGIESDKTTRKQSTLDLSSIETVGYAPVISWVQAGNWTDMDTVDLADCEILPLVPGAGKRSFYLVVRGLSNAPYFEEGEKICIDPDWCLEDIQTGEMVVVSCDGEATFKALISEPNGYYLKALNPQWNESIIELKDNCTLVGKYVGSFRPPKRFNLS